MTKDELRALLDYYLPVESEPTIHLATCDNEAPHVRPLTLVRDGLNLYFATSRHSDKIRHVGLHREVEFSCLLETAGKLGCLRVAGRLSEVTGTPLQEAWRRASGYDASLHFAGGLDDPDLIAFRVEPTRAMLREPGKPEVELDINLFS
jgi:general stress protein 26